MKANRAIWMDWVSCIGIGVLFWGLVICGIIGDTSYVAPWVILIYAICSIWFINITIEKDQIRKKILLFVAVEAMQLVPYVIILLIRGLF